MSPKAGIKVKPIVPGYCKGEVLLLNRFISFFGEVDPETSCLRENMEICVASKVLVFKGSRGSTVGPYIIYALKKNNKHPVCMIVEEAEPLLIAGCVLGEIPLYVVESINALESGKIIEVKVEGNEYYIYAPD
ncbi:MAG: DUF126 domain-containing protein [Desulfurococcaceae archaeon]